MTFEELLELNNPEGIESLSDEELKIILAPCLKNCPPIDIMIIEAKNEEEKIKKELKKEPKKLTLKMLDQLKKELEE